jgi:hypothetical protein
MVFEMFGAAVRRGWVGLLAGLFCGLVLAQSADPPGRVGRLAEVHGQVWLYDPDQREWVGALVNRPLTSGDRIATDDNARAEIRIGSTTVRLGGDSELAFDQLDDQAMRLQLNNGSLAARLRSPESAAEFSVVTPEGRLQPRRPGHYRIDRRDQSTRGEAMAGDLHFESDDSALDLGNGRAAEFWREAGAMHYTWDEPERDGFSQWVLADDARDDRLAAARHVSPEMTGWEDLDRYGRWEQNPEYGMVWQPTQVGPGWAPYRDGRWAWVPPWGWTWVDAAPWGFAPFHYGRWVNVRGNWCWAPGSYTPRPVYAPALVAWGGTPPIGVSIRIGSRPPPPTRWVPLGPREVYQPNYPVTPSRWRHFNPHAPDALRPRFDAPRPTPLPPSDAPRHEADRRSDDRDGGRRDGWQRAPWPVAPAVQAPPRHAPDNPAPMRPPVTVAPPAPGVPVVEPPGRHRGWGREPDRREDGGGRARWDGGQQPARPEPPRPTVIAPQPMPPRAEPARPPQAPVARPAPPVDERRQAPSPHNGESTRGGPGGGDDRRGFSRDPRER